MKTDKSLSYQNFYPNTGSLCILRESLEKGIALLNEDCKRIGTLKPKEIIMFLGTDLRITPYPHLAFGKWLWKDRVCYTWPEDTARLSRLDKGALSL